MLTPGGDIIRELIGAFPSLVLAEGEYVVIARHDAKTYQSTFQVNRVWTATSKLLQKRAANRGRDRMQTFFVQIKCALGRTYEVASALAEAEIASEIYSIAGDFDILAKFYVESRRRHRPFRRPEGAGDSRHRRHPHHHHLQGVLTPRASLA